MSATFDDSIKVLAQSWEVFKKNKDINIWKIRTSNMSDWKVTKCFRKCCIILCFKRSLQDNLIL